MLSDDEAKKINALLLKVKKGDMLRVSYYNIDRYETTVGICNKIDLVLGKLMVLKQEIDIKDIEKIEIE